MVTFLLSYKVKQLVSFSFHPLHCRARTWT